MPKRTSFEKQSAEFWSILGRVFVYEKLVSRPKMTKPSSIFFKVDMYATPSI